MKKIFSKKLVEIKESPTIKIDILGNLPREISYKILVNLLTTDDIANAFACCKTWRQHMNYEYIWKSFYRKFFDCEEPNSEVYRKLIQSYSLHWQRRFIYERTLEFNYKNNIFKEVKIPLKYRNNCRCQYFDNQKMVMSSRRLRSLAVINTCTGLVVREFESINCLCVIPHENLLIAITYGLYLKIYNLEDGNCITDVLYVRDYNDLFRCELRASQHLVILAHGYPLINRYSFFNMKTQTFNVIEGNVCVGCTENRIAIANYITGSLKILDCDLNLLMEFDCLAALRIIEVIINKDFVVKQFEDPPGEFWFSVWSIKTKTNFKIRFFYERYYGPFPYGKLTSSNKLIFQFDEKHCKVWDLCKATCQFCIAFPNHIYEVRSIDSCIIVSLYTKLSKIYCVKTGTFVKNFSLVRKNLSLYAMSKGKLLYYYYYKNPPKICWRIADYEINMVDTEKPTSSSCFSFLNTKRLRICRNK